MSDEIPGRKTQPYRAPAQRTPALIAIGRMARLATTGASPGKMLDAIDNVLIHWGAEGLDPPELRDRIAQLQNDLDAGLEAAEQFASEAETDGQRRGAQNQVAALKAVRDRLMAAREGR